ncbi:uncharacterized protein LOC134534960 isoform X2 [Bacillus rossius redtenbacheri]|uniref:uncharacterized protein LOC134534960 isoform X2 n=1 Tax=Bacillus rossius redtenbacheri TaxID=93214 RepID=UPI002FDE2796
MLLLLLLLLFARSCCSLSAAAADVPKLPDTSGIDFVLTDRLHVDKFFSLWLVFNNDEMQTSDEPFTIFAPVNSNDTFSPASSLLTRPDLVKKLLLDHMVLGVKLNLNLNTGLSFTTLGGRTVHVRSVNGTLYANKVKVLQPRVEVPHGILVVLDDYLFPEDLAVAGASAPPVGESLVRITAPDDARPKNSTSSAFLRSVGQVLSFLKSGVKVFRQFLSRSNVSRLLRDDEEYTVFVPTDHAFQRWHPIDWGFYPFSVPEFTESIIVNHFVKGNLRQDGIQEGQRATTLGGWEVVFAKKNNSSLLTVNGVQVVKGDTPVAGGNMMFLGEVMFVDDDVVSRLYADNRDKETAPLIAFPWMRSQFLSHAFLALEKQPVGFAHVTRFLNMADIAPFITGKGYTFFVPTDQAFEDAGLGGAADNLFSKGAAMQVLLNHFVKGRLYNRDLTEGRQLHALGDAVITVGREDGRVTVNGANIVEREVFVYNLGTMYYIDKVLFSEGLAPVAATTAPDPPAATGAPAGTTDAAGEAEGIPSELEEGTGTLPDLLEEADNATATSYEVNEFQDEPYDYEDQGETLRAVPPSATEVANVTDVTDGSLATDGTPIR